MRCRVVEIASSSLRVVGDDGAEAAVRLAGTPFERLLKTAEVGDCLNVVGGTEHRGMLTADFVVLEPDLLVDVTTLCGCLKDYGFNAANSLLNRYESRETTWQIQLGNMANDFFDSCVNEGGGNDGGQGGCASVGSDSSCDDAGQGADFLHAVRRSFHAAPLVYTALEGIDKFFFHDARQQFDNIRKTVRETLPQLGVTPQDIMLEPQFLAPSLGLQGRMDALSPRAIIELKSGKADEFHGGRPKEEHELQMILYKEILERAERPSASRPLLLFYSRYPRLQQVGYTRLQVQQAIAVRNDIVALERDTRLGRLPAICEGLCEGDFNTSGADGKLYLCYQRPIIMRFLQRMGGMPPVVAAYFHAFARFIAAEQHASKVAFASLWNTPVAVRQAEGEAVAGLRLQPVFDTDGSVVEVKATSDDDLSAINFRRGDSVMLYCPPDDGAGTPSIQTFRCQIVGIGQHSLHLALTFKQRSERVFSLDRRYAIAPAYMEATYLQACRGLTALVSGDAARRDLLLGVTRPDEGGWRLEDGDWPYFLLVGPPGTGKTNVHLRRMVREGLDRGETLLVMAYTNQAVDEICRVLEDECPGGYARIGNENSCAAPFRRRMMSRLVDGAANRREMRAVIDSLRVVAGTIASIAPREELFRLKRFDLTIVDEASQVLEPQLLPTLMRVDRFVLIGDHKQLPAVVQQCRAGSEVSDPLLRDIALTNCADSYFERLYALQHRWGIAHLTTATLSRQGRMHRDLMGFVNTRFYGGLLDIVPLPRQTASLPEGLRRREFIDSAASEILAYNASAHTSAASDSVGVKANPRHAAIVAGVIARLQSIYKASGRSLRPADIGVIVPFRAQIAAIRNAVAPRAFAEAMTIDTVERYQGSQRDIIIFDTVITSPGQIDTISAPVVLDDGTVVDRKLNVALTRAREQIIVVGHRPTLLRSELYADLVQFLEA